MRFTLVLLFLVSITGCATGPDFKPSSPVEKATSGRVAVSICEEYTIQIKDQTSAPVRSLKPWVSCLETTLRKFPEIRDDRRLVSLFRALSLRVNYSRADESFSDYAAMNDLVYSVLEPAPTGVPHPACVSSRGTYASKELPRFAESLAAFCGGVAGSANGSLLLAKEGGMAPTPLKSHPELGMLAEDLQAVFEKPGVHGRKIKLQTKEAAGYCSEFRLYIKDVSDLRDLLDYRDVVDANGHKEDAALKRKLTDRIDELKSRSLETHKVLEAKYNALEEKPVKADCFFVDGVRKPKKTHSGRRRHRKES